MKSIFFSVVIPVYNSSSYISDTLDSVREAFNKEKFEIIIIDDCSDDIKALSEILIKYPESILIEKLDKSNAADSRNIGFLKSRGDYVFFLDSDDHLIKSAVERRVKLHEAKSAGMVFGEFLVNCGDEKKCINLPRYDTEDMRNYLFLKKGDCRSSSITICKKNYKNTLFDPLSFKHQDWIYAIKCFDNNESIFFDSEPSVQINIDRAGRMSSTMNITASKYMCDNYITNTSYLNSFSKKHWLSMIYFKDKAACEFFFSIFKPESLYDRCQLTLYKIASASFLLNLSSFLVSFARKIK